MDGIAVRATRYLVCPEEYVDEQRAVYVGYPNVGLIVEFTNEGWMIFLRWNRRVFWSEKRGKYFSMPFPAKITPQFFDECCYQTPKEAISIARRLLQKNGPASFTTWEPDKK